LSFHCAAFLFWHKKEIPWGNAVEIYGTTRDNRVTFRDMRI